MRLFRFLLSIFSSAPTKHSDNIRATWDEAPRYRAEHPMPSQTSPRQANSPVPNRNLQAVAQVSALRGRCYVVDGDTIVINNINIRLAGIDAPEMDQPYGNNAKWALHKLCNGHVINAEFADHFSYERHVATCFLPDGRDLAAEMVSLGMALDWHKFSGGKYRHLEPEGVRKKLWRVQAKHQGRMPAKTLN